MKFQQLQLYGFKSFADKTAIPFKDGFTAIIGPNGCGKSNVLESIRFVLGEQAPSELRVKSMREVIFAGTETGRRAMSYCDVSLTFDNTNGQIFPTLPFDQVVLTRKLDASGHSEYYINNTKTLQRDVVTLLRDTGIGKDGYSMIGQGKVEKILSQKPEERRSVFDEAAGISKHRANRKDSIESLKKADINLQAINDVIAEIQRSIEPLKKQAATAQKYEELHEKLKIEEVNLYIYNYENHREKKEKYQANIIRYGKEIAECEERLAQCKQDHAQCLKDSNGIDLLNDNYNAELLQLKVGAEKAAGDQNLIKEKVNNLQAEIKRLKGELNANAEDARANSESIDTAEKKKIKEIADKNQIAKQLSDAQERLSLISTALEGHESDFQAKNEEYIEAIKQLGNLQDSLSAINAEHAIHQSRSKTLRELIDLKKAKLNEVSTDLALCEAEAKASSDKIKDLTSKRNETVYGKNEASEAIRALDEDIVSLNTQRAEVEGRLRLEERVKEEYEGYQEAVKRLMKDARLDPNIARRILGVLAEVIKVPADYEAAIEYALGGALQHVLVETERDAGDLITYLKQKGYGRVTFRPRTACKNTAPRPELLQALNEPGARGIASELIEYDTKFYPFIQALLGSTLIVDGISAAERIWKTYNQAFRIVTLDGEIYARGGEITGGSRRSQKSGLLSQEKQIEQLKANLNRIRKNIEILTSQREENQREIILADETIVALDKDLQTLRIDNARATEKFEQAREDLKEIQAEIEANVAEYDEVEAKVKELAEKIKAIDDYQNVVKEKQKEFDILKEMRSKNAENKSESDELRSLVMDLNVRYASCESTINSIDMDLTRLRSEKRRLNDEKVDLVALLQSVESSLDDIKQTPEKTHFTEEDKKRINELEEQIAGLAERRKELKERLAGLEIETSELYKKHGEANEKKIRAEEMIERIDSELRQLQEHILEEYNLTYQSALEFKIEEYNSYGAKTSIEGLKKAINALGPVNHQAKEMLVETEARLEEQMLQRDDIVKARDDILTIIREITEEMRRKFTEAFAKIQENYQVVFKQLFEGGTGSVSLDTTETDDPLEAGINIFAQPPGKKIVNILSLSGGERSLAAIALLFAILMIRPAPFCVLDEIDSALDPSNAIVFASYLKKFPIPVQFIVITHRKETMNYADSIFGITMEEKGVTKVVSITFEEAQKMKLEDTAVRN